MPKRVLDVGNCSPDFAAIKGLLSGHFECTVEQAHSAEDALATLRTGKFSLVTINRKLDCDYSDGLEIIRAIKADATLAKLPVMLITNFPEHQEAAEAAGALRGFGKLEFDHPETLAKLMPILG
ncbi:MAG: response regulator [Pirellulales bacterium]|nr:response regulator [Pirellulales bacterium]